MSREKRKRWKGRTGKGDTTERLHFHFSLSCIGEGNGNRLQWSCLGNPRDGGAWWAAVYGVAQSRTRLKRLSSSSKAWCFLENEAYRCYFSTKTFIRLIKICVDFILKNDNPPIASTCSKKMHIKEAWHLISMFAKLLIVFHCFGTQNHLVLYDS